MKNKQTLNNGNCGVFASMSTSSFSENSYFLFILQCVLCCGHALSRNMISRRWGAPFLLGVATQVQKVCVPFRFVSQLFIYEIITVSHCSFIFTFFGSQKQTEQHFRKLKKHGMRLGNPPASVRFLVLTILTILISSV